MAETKSNRFTKYFPLLLDALRSSEADPMRPAAAIAWIRSRVEVPREDLSRIVINGRQSIFENDVHWARFYLVKGGLIYSPKRGLWALTSEGRQVHLTTEETWDLYVRVRDENKRGPNKQEEELPAPGADDDDDLRSYWFAGSIWNKSDDQLARFLKEGIWQNGGDEDQYTPLILRMRPGDQIAIKSSFVKRLKLPFDVAGASVSAMRIKATGTILKNLGDGKTVQVAWDPPAKARDWYFYTYRNTLAEARTDSAGANRLIDFTFRGLTQDYQWFLSQPSWAKKYGTQMLTPINSLTEDPDVNQDEFVETQDQQQSYTIDDIFDEGCFLAREELEDILERWRLKKNLILQGPPGTGKTWLAKRLGFALVGSNNRETTRSRLRVVQFHPSLSYEDFVRGWRPSGDGRLSLIDGILMQSIADAASEPDIPFVLVIEEINRGNPAQIFGEMLTLLEDTKRSPSEAIELAYRREPGERVHVPENLYVIGTMNVADRSLAIVDLALRRRFAFVDLEPRLGQAWHEWCLKRGFEEGMLAEISKRIDMLNDEISASISLGPQFRIGHSFVTPEIHVSDCRAWFLGKVESEIGPLLDEYWYDAPETSKSARAKLLARLG